MALQQNDNNTVIHFLLSTEIIPLCLRIMETGSELSKTVAIFIVQKILLDETGLTYICHTYERFYAVGTVLSNMVNQLVETQAVRLLKHVVRCYLRLSDNLRQVHLKALTHPILNAFQGQGSITCLLARTSARPDFQRSAKGICLSPHLCSARPNRPFFLGRHGDEAMSHHPSQ